MSCPAGPTTYLADLALKHPTDGFAQHLCAGYAIGRPCLASGSFWYKAMGISEGTGLMLSLGRASKATRQRCENQSEA